MANQILKIEFNNGDAFREHEFEKEVSEILVLHLHFVQVYDAGDMVFYPVNTIKFMYTTS